MPVSFKNTHVCNTQPAQVTEDIYRAFGAYGGIHDFLFDALYHASIAAASIGSDWEGTWLIDGPIDVLVEATTTTANEFGIIVAAPPTTITGLYMWSAFLFGIDENDHPFVSIGTSEDSWQKIHISPEVVSPTGTYTFAFRQVSWRENEIDKWYAFSIWRSGELVMTYMHPTLSFNNENWNTSNYRLGIATKSVVNFSSLRVPQATEFIEWNSIDPGEYAISGLQRAIEGRYIKHFLRYNGSFRAFKPGVRPVVDTITDDDIDQFIINYDRRTYATHVRMVGAYTESESVASTQAPYRFVEVNNPMIMNAEDCRQESIRQAKRIKEGASAIEMTLPFRPLWEIEDLIQINADKYIISSISVEFETPTATANIQLRKYYDE